MSDLERLDELRRQIEQDAIEGEIEITIQLVLLTYMVEDRDRYVRLAAAQFN